MDVFQKFWEIISSGVGLPHRLVGLLVNADIGDPSVMRNRVSHGLGVCRSICS